MLLFLLSYISVHPSFHPSAQLVWNRFKVADISALLLATPPCTSPCVFLPGVQCCCLVTKSCLTCSDPMGCNPPGSSVHGKDTGVGCHFLLQRIFPTQGSNPCIAGRFFTTEPLGKPVEINTTLLTYRLRSLGIKFTYYELHKS